MITTFDNSTTADSPWAAYSQKLDGVNTKEALELAGLDWTVAKCQLEYRLPIPKFNPTDEEVISPYPEKARAYITYRTDTNHCFGVVGPNYSPLQNADAFSFLQPFLDSGDLEIERAGSFNNGAKVFFMATRKNNSVADVANNDPIKKYVLIANSHDGSTTLRIGYTPIRVVCQNTLEAAMRSENSQLVRVFHNGAILSNGLKASEMMAEIDRVFEGTLDEFRYLARKVVSNEKDLRRFVNHSLYRPGADHYETSFDTLHEQTDAERRVINLFEEGRGNDNPAVRHTYWTAYNAVTEYLQYYRGKKRTVTQEQRLSNMWFGDSKTVSGKALELALAA